MRLLHCRTLELEDYFQNAAPSYTILSHTWEKEELTCQEILNIHGSHEYAKKKAGYLKIVNCCKQAIEDGFEYVWIDTCCIDKSSSAELSEAINSVSTRFLRVLPIFSPAPETPISSTPQTFRRSVLILNSVDVFLVSKCHTLLCLPCRCATAFRPTTAPTRANGGRG